MLNKFLQENTYADKVENYGDLLLAWKVAPKVSKKFWVYVIGLIGGMIIFLVYYGKQLLPWLKNIPDFAIYMLILLISPFLKFISDKAQDKEVHLYEQGFIIKTINREKVETGSGSGLWKNFKSCSLDKAKISLFPATLLKRKVVLEAPQNPKDVYLICRERINMALADESNENGHKRRTPQQRHLARVEKKINRRNAKLYGHTA